MMLLQGLLTPQAIAGLGIGIVVAVVTAVAAFLQLRRSRVDLQRRHADLAATARRNKVLVEASGEGVLELDSTGLVRYANPAAARLLGYEVQQLIGLDYRVLINARDMHQGTANSKQVRYLTDIARGVGALLRRQDGQYRPVEYRVVPINEQGSNIGTVLTFSDVSDRVRLDTLVRDMQRTARVGGWEFDLASRRLTWTDAGFAPQEMPLQLGMSLERVLEHFAPADRSRIQDAGRAVRESGLTTDLEVRLTVGQREMWIRLIIKGERRDGAIVRLHGTFQDITDRIQSERQVRATRDFYELTLDAMPVMVMYINTSLILTYANNAVAQWLDRPRERTIGKHLKEVLAAADFIAIMDDIDTALRGQPCSGARSISAGGRSREMQYYLVPQITSDQGVLGYFAIFLDITDVKRLEQRLVQAQKMEAIGQLTGGVAHDFNNLLGVVLGNLQLLERSVSNDPALARKVHTAMRAAIRGADLTKRLLAFARKEIFDPVVINLERQLTAMADLMQRTLGDAIDVRLRVAPDAWRTRVDPGQLENAILNLAINARDAMPHGGKLTLQAGNIRIDAAFCLEHPQLEPGDYVYISVADTGCGIAPEVLSRVFEPFFTTKESGKGSGLGLAMVHSLAEQSGGIATIESVIGRGTTVRILLPRCDEEQAAHEDTLIDKIAPRGHETILVVEDDADLRETVVTCLMQLGYRALAAANAEAALRILAGSERVHLLFTDVMMPGGILGPALARRARELRPGINVLFTTGYADTSVLGGASVTPGDIIQKPYRNEDLAVRIRSVLDREVRVA